MPIHIKTVTTDITVVDGELTLSERQLERLAEAVMQRIDAKHSAQRKTREATELRRSAAPPSPISD